MNIILVGYAASEAAHRLIMNEKPALSCRFSDRFINNALRLTGESQINRDSIKQMIYESGIQIQDDDILELSDMGVFGGLWEFADKNKSGLKIYLSKISILQETIEICEHLNVNPYTYPSQGSYIIRTDDAYALADYLCTKQIEASVIGTETEENDRIVINQGEIRYLTPIDRLLKDEQEVKNLRYSERGNK